MPSQLPIRLPWDFLLLVLRGVKEGVAGSKGYERCWWYLYTHHGTDRAYECQLPLQLSRVPPQQEQQP